MKRANGILLVIVGLLLLADLSWRGWSRLHERPQLPRETGYITNAIGGKVRLVAIVHSNSVAGAMDAVAISRDKTPEPLWAEWDFDNDGTPDTISYFFQSNVVMNIHLRTNKLPRREVIFYDKDGKTTIEWGDRSGMGLFTERTLHGQGGESRMEVWYGEAWHRVEKRNQKNGIIQNGKWFQLTLATNGMWTKK